MCVASEAFDFFKQAAMNGLEDAGRIVSEWIEETAPSLRWLGRIEKDKEQDGRDVRLVHTYNGSLWDRLVEHLKALTPTEFFVLSPFHDKGGETALRLSSEWPSSKINMVVQSGYTNLNMGPLEKVPGMQLLEIQGSANNRRTHAKLLAWRHEKGSGCLVGSANFTSAALNARNVETCLLVDSSNDVMASLFDEKLSTKEIQFDDFEPGVNIESESRVPDKTCLQLKSVILENATSLRVNYRHQLETSPKALRLEVRAISEPRARLSVKLPNKRDGNEEIVIQDNKLSDARETLLATLVAETSHGHEKSAPLFIIQPDSLTFETREGNSTPEKRVQESGEGLIEFIDEIGNQGGVTAVVECIQKLMIRYEGGGGKRIPRRFRVQIRDPYATDVAPEWLISSKSESKDVADAIKGFNERHEKLRLRKHAKSGNINGIENFLEIMRAMVKLTYVYHLREDIPNIGRSSVIHICSRCLELATSGIDSDDDFCEGFLNSMWNSLSRDVETLQEVLSETAYTAEIRAVLLIAQRTRFVPDEIDSTGKSPQRPKEVLISRAAMVSDALAECGIGEPNSGEVKTALESYRLFSEDELAALVEEL